MKKMIIDMCSIDKIASDDNFSELLLKAINKDKIMLLTMDILDEQYGHSKVPPESRKLINALPLKRLHSEAFIWGQPWGSKWGDGSHTGLSVSQIITDKGNHIADSLIAVTSNGNADVFVTDDKILTAKLKKISVKCQVWNSEGLKNI